jgi:hypothetical protein
MEPEQDEVFDEAAIRAEWDAGRVPVVAGRSVVTEADLELVRTAMGGESAIEAPSHVDQVVRQKRADEVDHEDPRFPTEPPEEPPVEPPVEPPEDPVLEPHQKKTGTKGGKGG